MCPVFSLTETQALDWFIQSLLRWCMWTYLASSLASSKPLDQELTADKNSSDQDLRILCCRAPTCSVGLLALSDKSSGHGRYSTDHNISADLRSSL